MQALCGLQGIFDLFNCKTPESDLIFEESSFDLLQDILETAGELEERVPYEDLVTTEFAEIAAQ